jgi:chemotaxis protein methyltransferase CheR
MQEIIRQIKRVTGRDISVYAGTFLQKAINHRISEKSVGDEEQYLDLLKSGDEEVDALLDSMNISYSLFFRSPLDYCMIERFILPSLFHRKGNSPTSSVRIWSAGCACGQEPYSLAIIGDELARYHAGHNPPLIFATDLSTKALELARTGAYYPDSVQNVRFSQMEAFFTKPSQQYLVNPSLRNHIEFSQYDLLDSKTGSPPSGIFGGFDMVTCCNLMVYYKREIQEQILDKLYHSLCSKGFLMVDPSEKAIVKSFRGFRLYSALGNIFVKN